MKQRIRRSGSARRDEIGRLEQALQRPGSRAIRSGFVLSTPCALAVINQEDLTGETDQQNLPGSTWQYPNWRRKMKVAVERFRSASREPAESHPALESLNCVLVSCHR